MINVGDQSVVGEYVRDVYRGVSEVAIAFHPERNGAGHDLLIVAATEPDLFSRWVMISNVDTILGVNNEDFLRTAMINKVEAMLLATNRTNVPNSGAYLIDPTGKVISSREFNDYDPNAVNADANRYTARVSSCGGVILSRNCLLTMASEYEPTPGAGEVSLYRDVLPVVHKNFGLHTYTFDGTFIDFGTPEYFQQFLAMPLIGAAEAAVA